MVKGLPSWDPHLLGGRARHVLPDVHSAPRDPLTGKRESQAMVPPPSLPY
jgi:hypothetical protein